jgi:hypothetical protein
VPKRDGALRKYLEGDEAGEASSEAYYLGVPEPQHLEISERLLPGNDGPTRIVEVVMRFMPDRRVQLAEWRRRQPPLTDPGF